MAVEGRNFYCERCKRTKDGSNFYSSNNLEKYPEGKLHLCKECATAHIDNWDSSTYLWLLQECDVPYIPDEWNKLMLKYTKDKTKVTGATIFGRYLSKMRLNQHKNYRWADSEFLQQQANLKTKETMERQGFGAAEIETVLNGQQLQLPEKPLTVPASDLRTSQEIFDLEPPPDYFANQNAEYDTDIAASLTEEDKKYLLLKWGKMYRPDEWVKLEQLYNDMMESYDIQTAGHIDNLKKLCKTSLKADQLLDLGDVDGAQKMLKVYDALMKLGKFSAVQNKAESGEFVDSIGELVALCEKQGYIERFYTEKPRDKVDQTLKDMQRYTTNLVTGESDLANLLENAIKQVQREDANMSEETEIIDDTDIEEVEKQLKTDDFADFSDFIEEETQEDIEKMLDLLGQR